MRPAQPISIWQPQLRDGETVWVRPAPGPFGDHYATRPELRRKRAELPLRVLLFGESVAAGYGYAPHLTPAQVLEAQLQQMGGASNFEVIDLARTNETLAGLRASVRASLQINPDVLVLFAGNNWTLLETPELSAYAGEPGARAAFVAALRARGLDGPIELAWQQLETGATLLFEEIGLIARTVGIPVIVVIPEVNLADWENRQPVAWLPGDGVAQWHRHYASASAALAAADWSGAIEAAQHMLALDGGRCPTAWRMVARARLGLGDAQAASVAARAEVDRCAYPAMAFLGSPQASARIQSLLRKLARQTHMALVDLPEILAAHGESPFPGRRYFLDYCHLTAEGMAVAMAAVSAKVLDASGMVEPAPDWQRVLAQTAPLEVRAEVEAIACFGAAIHGAHRLLTTGTKLRVLEDWCRAARQAAPEVVSAMLDWVAARAAAAPAVLSAAFQRNADSRFALSLQHGWRWEQLDADVLCAIARVLPDHAGTIERLLCAAVADAPLELCSPPWTWLWEPLERFYPDALVGAGATPGRDDIVPAYLRCPWPQTSFALLCRGTRDLDLHLSVRLPQLPGAGPRAGSVEVRVGDRVIATVAATSRWSQSAVRVPRADLRAGLNRVSLEWPLPAAIDIDPLDWVAERLAQGLRADLHPVFGEVFSLQVR